MRGGAIYGRLAMPPPYDDVSYFVDALERMRIFLDQGFFGLLQNLISSPPHAPYSTIAALLAFLFGGPYLAGPYYMNALAMAVLTGALFWAVPGGNPEHGVHYPSSSSRCHGLTAP